MYPRSTRRFTGKSQQNGFSSIFAHLNYMKTLAVIFSVYILALTAIPCVERPFEKDVHQTGLSKSATHNHDREAGHCSPFCVCSCCGNHIVYIENIVLSTVFAFPGKQVFWFTPDLTSHPYHSIWQPPKIS